MVGEHPMSPSPAAGRENSITVAAHALQQNTHRLYLAAFSARDLVRITTVDYFTSRAGSDGPEQGYQRPPERSRITRIGTYLLEELGDGLFPTAVVLAARKPVDFDAARGEIHLTTKEPLQVIDGQHRVAGLRYVIEEKDHHEFDNFMVPAVIVEVADRITEMNQFRIINGTAKSVRTDLVNTILAATASVRGDDAVKDSERWKVVTTKVVDSLNREPRSPWAGRIVMPDESLTKGAKGKIVRATSFATSLRPVYSWLKQLSFFQGSSIEEEAERIYNLLVDYWGALSDVNPAAFARPHDYVIQKTPGLFALHLVLREELLPSTYQDRQPWTRATFGIILQRSPEITDADYWLASDGGASAYGSMKGFAELADLLVQSLRSGA